MSKVKINKKDNIKLFKRKKIYCEGGFEDSGHPKIFLVISKNEDSVSCPYCGKQFTRTS
tara:strand:- start:1210 stop:1386 length:177 start_codon:yes stop_codon:yes gene_type:complete